MAGKASYESSSEAFQTLTTQEVELFGTTPPMLAGISGARELADIACKFGEELSAEITPIKVIKAHDNEVAITQILFHEETPETTLVSGEISIIEADGAISTIRFTVSKEDVSKLYSTLIGDEEFTGVIPLKERFGPYHLKDSVKNGLRGGDPSKYATSLSIEKIDSLDPQVSYTEKLEYLWNLVAKANGIDTPHERNFLESLDLRRVSESIPRELTLLDVMLLVDTFAPDLKISAKQVMRDMSMGVEYKEVTSGKYRAIVEPHPIDDITDSAFTGAIYDIGQEIATLRALLSKKGAGIESLDSIIQKLKQLESLWEEHAQSVPLPQYEDVTFEVPDNATIMDFAVVALKIYKLEPSTNLDYFESAKDAIDILIENKIIDKSLITKLRNVVTQVAVYSFLNSELVKSGKDTDMLKRQIPLNRQSLRYWGGLIMRSLHELGYSHNSDLVVQLRRRFEKKILTTYRRLNGYFGASSNEKKRIDSEARELV